MGGADLDALWDAVVAAPEDRERRLVLADALSERGDPRGELIALQCMGGEAAGEANVRASELVENHRDAWLGELAGLIEPGERYRGGLLDVVRVGRKDTDPAVWERAPAHRELCALRFVGPGYAFGPTYVKFLARLVRMPRWVLVEDSHLRQLATARATWPFANVEYQPYPPPRDLERPLLAIAALAPGLVGVRLRVPHYLPLHAVAQELGRVARRVPALRRIQLVLPPDQRYSEGDLEDLRVLGALVDTAEAREDFGND